MRKYLIALLSACISLPALATTPPGYTNIVSTLTTDASGALLASGTATFQVIDLGGHPLPVKLSQGGQIHTEPVSVAVTNGAFSANVIDVSQTLPSFPCVMLTITDNATGAVVWQNNCLQPVGSTYDLDQFSTNTTPIYPVAGQVVQGNLSINGNLGVTGNLSVGGLSLINLAATNGSIEVLNGSVNATLFPGADIGAQTNNALASCSDSVPCHVYIPPGVYSYSTPILLPRRTQGLEFTCDRNATLNYTGVGDAFGTQPAVNTTNAAGTLLDGGCAVNGTSAATSGVHFRPGQGYSLVGWQISGFSQGDGIWVDGANVVWITQTSSKFNLNGLHVTGNRCNASNACRWDRPSAPNVWVDSGINDSGYSANAVKANLNRFTQNAHWGILEGDYVGGSNTQSFNNSYVDNDLEGNGTAGAPYGGALVGFSRAATFERDYLEGNPAGIVIGCVSGTPSGVAPQSGYTAQFCGTADKTVVRGNFFNDLSTASEVLLNYANSPTIDDNGVNGNAACLADNHISNGDISLHGNHVYGTGAYTCQGGVSGGPLENFRDSGDSNIPGRHFFGTTQVDGTFTTGTLTELNTGNPTMGTATIVGTIGAITIWQSSSDPGGTCGSAPNTSNIWLSPLGLSICQSGTWTKVGH